MCGSMPARRSPTHTKLGLESFTPRKTYTFYIIIASAMSIESVDNTRVDGIARRMQQCWISTIGYRTSVTVPPQECDNVRSDRIAVQGGSRGPIPNK